MMYSGFLKRDDISTAFIKWCLDLGNKNSLDVCTTTPDKDSPLESVTRQRRMSLNVNTYRSARPPQGCYDIGWRLCQEQPFSQLHNVFCLISVCYVFGGCVCVCVCVVLGHQAKCVCLQATPLHQNKPWKSWCTWESPENDVLLCWRLGFKQ